MSNLNDLKAEAERRVALENDAWNNLSGAERTAEVYRTMLAILEEEEESTFINRLMVARAVWENRLWSVTDESFAGFLCEVGGRYRQGDGRPSGVAYDLANYVSIVWDVLEDMGENPVQIAAAGWSKARLTVSAIRQNIKLLTEDGKETRSAEQAVTREIVNQKGIDDVVTLVKDEDVTFREMAAQTYTPRVPPFEGTMSLKKDGTWDVQIAGLTEQQMTLVQKALRDHGELRIV